MDITYTAVSVNVPAEAAEAVAALLAIFALDDEGVAIEQLGDPADLDPNALLPDATVRLYIDRARDDGALRAAIEQTLALAGQPLPRYEQLAPADWTTAWRAHYHPTRVGAHFVIQPSWEPLTQRDPADRVITLDPGMAFGTGTHPTTRLCLALLEAHVQPGDDVLDLGSGSGVLAIGAALLGAGRVLAVDTDPLAVAASADNAARNGVAAQIDVLTGSLAAVTRRGWRVLVANILATVLIDMLAHAALLDYVAPGGTLILSGILAAQLPDITAALAQQGQTIAELRQEADWIALAVRRAA